MSEISADALSTAMTMICVTCFSSDRTLKPIKERDLMSIICPEKKFSEQNMICWECEAIIQKIKLFKVKVLSAQSLIRYMANGTAVKTKSLSGLKRTDAEIISISPQTPGSQASELIDNNVIKVEHIYDIKKENVDVKTTECNVSNKNDCNEDDDEIMDPLSDMLASDGDSMDTSESESVINNAGRYSSRIQKEKVFNQHRQSQSTAYDYLQEYIPKIEINENVRTLKDLLNQPLQYLAQGKETSQMSKGTDKDNAAVKQLKGKSNISVDVPNSAKKSKLTKANLQLLNGAANSRDIIVVNLTEDDEIPIKIPNKDMNLEKDISNSPKCKKGPKRNLVELKLSNEDVNNKMLNDKELDKHSVITIADHEPREERYEKPARIDRPGTSGNRKRKRDTSTIAPGYAENQESLANEKKDVTVVKDEQD